MFTAGTMALCYRGTREERDMTLVIGISLPFRGFADLGVSLLLVFPAEPILSVMDLRPDRMGGVVSSMRIVGGFIFLSGLLPHSAL